MAFLRAYDALPVDVRNVSYPLATLLDNLEEEDVEGVQRALEGVLNDFCEFLPAEDVTLINQAVEWLSTLNPDMLCELVEEL